MQRDEQNTWITIHSTNVYRDILLADACTNDNLLDGA